MHSALSTQHSSLRIIGVGNPLMGDDGAGIAVVEQLAAQPLPPRVEVVDGGTGGLTLLDLMEGADEVWLIDAVEMERPPGTVLRFGLEDLPESPEGGAGFSLHAAGLETVLALGQAFNRLPPLCIYGIQPAVVERRLGLSPAVQRGVNTALKLLRASLFPG